jgi:methylated-DNA-[protein]-cysteine S-methyltransferase
MPTSFQQKVYAIVKKIPKGKTMSYKEISIMLSSSPRAVGQALKKNPYADVPCHRVVHLNGAVGGYFGVKNSNKKIKLLKKEGALDKLSH